MAGISTFQAVLLCVSTGLRSTQRERAVALAMRPVIAQARDPDAFIEAAPETQPFPRQVGNWTPARELVDDNRGLAGIE